MTPQSDEFSEIMQTAEDSIRPDRPVMSYPPRQVASSKFIREVQHTLGIEDDDRARVVADWVIDKMERFGAATARGVFDMNGNGPQCSWCGVIWPLCGHHHQSKVIDDEADGDEPR
jgi:hypothetical protein